LEAFFEDLDHSAEVLGPPQPGDPPRLTAPVIGEARRRGRYLRGRAFRLAMATLLKPFVAVARHLTAGPAALWLTRLARRPGRTLGLASPMSPPMSPPLSRH